MISKTEFLVYLDSPRHLWAKKNNLLDDIEPDEFSRHLSRQGYDVENLAVEYFKQVLIPLRGNKSTDLSLQVTVETEDFSARTDALLFNPKTQKWDIFEIKAATSISKHNRYDATFQRIILESEYEIGDVYILHLNRKYFRDGEINLDEIFVIENINESIEELSPEVEIIMSEIIDSLNSADHRGLPACTNPKTCPCKNICFPGLPPYSIYNLRKMPGNIAKLEPLLERGVIDINDIPTDYPLYREQRRQVDTAQKGEAVINKKAISKQLRSLNYPLYFIDYEGYNPAIPMFDGYHPYDQVAFQYSLHVINEEGGKPVHFEFLEDSKSDPALNFAASLEKNIGTEGSIIVWNKSYEGSINKRLAKLYPRYKDLAVQMNNRIFDLMLIFKDQLYDHPNFKGSFSIKKILPVLAPDFSYENLEIANGGASMTFWYEMVYGQDFSAQRKAEVHESLLKYCEMDSLAMVKIWEHLVAL